MVESKKENWIMEMIKEVLGYIPQIISASVFSPIAQSTELIMKNIEERIMQMEKRIMRKISSLLIIGIGAIFLIFALFFFLLEFLGWSSTAAFFSIGIIIFVIGLLLKVGGFDK
ncbi:hypothetical protein COV13_00825 [Candidatus Woesearchaeota archaeon CG10_big_fil_rev_8_21_14_0_10_32_9]|nr:MAG: hypothetical protein COV13_00825 [Candidatus Woesearchaeota archaeon CG10_big_fil_rev_8_21_14_0_10_32_9]